MIQEEILFRLLQVSTATGAVALLITCMSMHRVKWWLPVPIYGLSFMLLVTFLTTFFMRRYTFEVSVATIAVLAISGVATALHAYIRPLPASRRDSLNRRVLWFVLPIVGILMTIWCVGSAYEGGITFFVRFEQKLNRSIDNQQKVLSRVDSAKAQITNLNHKYAVQDSTSSVYRQQLDARLQTINARLTDQSLRIHRLSTDQQKNRPY